MPGETDKHQIPYIEGSDAAASIDDVNQAQAERLDDIIAVDSQGTLANRPLSTPGNPGKIGRYYKATDTGQLFRDHGGGWDEITLGGARRAHAVVATEQATTSNAYANLATVGPSVTLDVPANALVLFVAQADIKFSPGAGGGLQFAVMGIHEATDVAAPASCGQGSDSSYLTVVTGPDIPGKRPVTPGTRTYTLRYMAYTGGTATFRNRKLWAWVVEF